MAQQHVTLTMDMTDINETIAEIKTLYGDGRGVPDHLRQRISAVALSEKKDDLIVLDEWPRRRDDGSMVYEVAPGPELLSILTTLRAVKR
jgi:hypothetical protein